MKTKHILSTGLCLLVTFYTFGQSRMILNGATVSFANGAFLVIDNPATNALTRNSGYLLSEGETNRVKWNAGTTAGTYTIPFGYSSTYLPVTFTKSSGTGSGTLVFSTYHTSWKNSSFLPTGVTSLGGNSPDQSAWALDRFWQIDAQGYTTKPSLTNLTFTYLDAEHQAAGNSIVESSLAAQQWNSATNGWNTVQAGGIINTVANTYKVASVPGTSFYKWWLLIDQLNPLATHLLAFDAKAIGKNALLHWTTSSEAANSEFVLQRSQHGNLFEDIARIKGKGGSGENDYQYTDTAAYKGVSYYRVKTVERTNFSYSDVRRIYIEDDAPGFQVYPSPVINKQCVVALTTALPEAALIFVMDKRGVLIKSYSISKGQQKVNLQLPTSLAAGSYLLELQTSQGLQHQQIVVY